MRLDWDTSWLLVAGVVAKRSRCVRYQTGTVIVDRRNRIVATGYIGPAATLEYAADSSCTGFCHRGLNGPTESTRLSYSDCTSIHSELNALLVCDRRDREGGTIYVTSVPCWTCAKAIANSGLTRAVVVDTRDEHAYRSPEVSLAYLRDCGLTVDVVQPPTALVIEEGRAGGAPVKDELLHWWELFKLAPGPLKLLFVVFAFHLFLIAASVVLP